MISMYSEFFPQFSGWRFWVGFAWLVLWAIAANVVIQRRLRRLGDKAPHRLNIFGLLLALRPKDWMLVFACSASGFMGLFALTR